MKKELDDILYLAGQQATLENLKICRQQCSKIFQADMNFQNNIRIKKPGAFRHHCVPNRTQKEIRQCRRLVT